MYSMNKLGHQSFSRSDSKQASVITFFSVTAHHAVLVGTA